ncbi:DUF5134 domain-containing protein [Streptomyces sp. NPDC058655]|uniref:DUF5134 domain-containing protein n=1 Tax=Streptomyces sp. NPDC058655 TaxID=3346577 RepID=UPI0036644503
MSASAVSSSGIPPSASVTSWLLVLLCAASGAYCLVRAGRAARDARGAAAGEAAMGLGMAVMAVPSGVGAWGPPLLLAVFCAAAAHALWLMRDGVHHAHHLVGSLAMAYMAYMACIALTATAGAAGPGPGGGQGGGHGDAHATGPPLVTGALLLYFAGYVLLGGARLVAAGKDAGVGTGEGGGPGGRPAATAAGAGAAAPNTAELTRACRLAMGIGTLAMLLTM